MEENNRGKIAKEVFELQKKRQQKTKKSENYMATLKLTIIPEQKLKDGRHKIRISIAHKSSTRFIPTPYIIDNPSQFKNGQVISRPDAAIMNSRLRRKLNFYQDALDSIPNIEDYSCTELKALLTSHKDYTNVTYKQAAQEYVDELSEEKREKSEKLYRLASKSFIKYEGDIILINITPKNIRHFEVKLEEKGLSTTTIKIYLTLVKVIVNYAKKRKMVTYETDPFEFCRMPAANIRELDLTIEEIKAIRDAELDHYNLRVVRDIFMLSYYLAGINLVDLLAINFKKQTILEYTRKKTKNKKQGERKTSFTIQPEAKEIIDRYMAKSGKLVFGKYDTFGKCYSVVSRKIAALAEAAGIEKRVVYYSARKSFVQHGFELGISLEILEYCIGQSMKSNRPIFNYFRVMRKHADIAIRKILDNLK